MSPAADPHSPAPRRVAALLAAAAITLAAAALTAGAGTAVGRTTTPPVESTPPAESWSAELALDGGDDTGVALDGGAVHLTDPATPAHGVLTLAPRRLTTTRANTITGVLTADEPPDTTVTVQARGIRTDGTWSPWNTLPPQGPTRLEQPTLEIQLRLLLTGPHTAAERPVVHGLWITATLTQPPSTPCPCTTPTTPATTTPVTTTPPVTTSTPVTTTPPTIPGRKVVFTGDYETGNLSQWQNCQTKDYNGDCGTNTRVGPAPNIAVVGVPLAHQGRFAAQFTVRDRDIPPFGGGGRAEVASEAPGAITNSGDERWYSWSMYFPDTFQTPVNDRWFIVMQWHGNDTNSPPLAINISPRGTVDVGGDGVPHPTKTLGPVRRGQWVDYTLHVLFSKDPRVGYVEGSENGVQTLPKTFRATDSGTGTYLKQGIYRDPSDKTTSVIWHDGLTVSAPTAAAMPKSPLPRLLSSRPNPPGTPRDEN